MAGNCDPNMPSYGLNTFEELDHFESEWQALITGDAVDPSPAPRFGPPYDDVRYADTTSTFIEEPRFEVSYDSPCSTIGLKDLEIKPFDEAWDEAWDDLMEVSQDDSRGENVVDVQAAPAQPALVNHFTGPIPTRMHGNAGRRYAQRQVPIQGSNDVYKCDFCGYESPKCGVLTSHVRVTIGHDLNTCTISWVGEGRAPGRGFVSGETIPDRRTRLASEAEGRRRRESRATGGQNY